MKGLIGGKHMLFKSPELGDQELSVVEKIDSMRKSLKYAISSPSRWFGVLCQATFARNIRHSTGIEGISVTRDDAMAAVEDEEPMEAGRANWLATLGYRNAMTYAHALADDPHFSYSEGLIRSLHFMMMQHDLQKTPGRYRSGLAFIQDELKQQRVYEGPDADIVPSLMKELVDSLNADSNLPVKVRAAMGHLNLVMIHPFSDGNGRMARCLETLILGREQIVEPPFCSIEEYLGRFTREYYDVLAEVGRGFWNPANGCRPWIRFNLVAHYRQTVWLLQRNRMTQRVWSEVEQIVSQRGLPERMIAALVNAAFGYRIQNSSYRTSAEVSEQVSSRDLKILVNEGLLVPAGHTRGRLYLRSKMLEEIYLRNYEKRTYEDPFVELQPSLNFPSEEARAS
jgi:Fic family protein